MSPQELATELRAEAKAHRVANQHLKDYPQRWSHIDATATTYDEAAALIETLTTDLATAGEQLRGMRETIKLACEFIEESHGFLSETLLMAEAMSICSQLSEAYHATPTTAELRAAREYIKQQGGTPA